MNSLEGNQKENAFFGFGKETLSEIQDKVQRLANRNNDLVGCGVVGNKLGITIATETITIDKMKQYRACLPIRAFVKGSLKTDSHYDKYLKVAVITLDGELRKPYANGNLL